MPVPVQDIVPVQMLKLVGSYLFPSWHTDLNGAGQAGVKAPDGPDDVDAIQSSIGYRLRNWGTDYCLLIWPWAFQVVGR